MIVSKYQNEIVNKLSEKESLLSLYAIKSKDGTRLINEEEDIRGKFSRDADRIIHCLSYTRYIDKTQVFSFNDNDNISKRITHVNQVSKIARTIGRALSLNEDLIEASALGHDLGHVPYGHVGEEILNKISLENNEGYFNHNVQSVRVLMILESKNLCIETLDAILCHNGELELKCYKPKTKNKESFLLEIENTYKNKETLKKLRPMTLEGCVVRISDIIAYIGRDIEDAVLLGILKIEDIPLKIRETLGNSNRGIINSLIIDIINNSYNKPYIAMSDEMFIVMKELKAFNYKYIYKKANNEKAIKKYEEMFRIIFNNNLNLVNNKNMNANIYKVFLNNMNDLYLKNTSNVRKVLDYIAGMTDKFFIKEYNCFTNKENKI